MSTRSLIGVLNKDGSVTHIYCHWDGYPSNNGKLLTEHYTDYQKIQQLLKLGDLSSLGEEIGEKHPFDTYNLPDEEKAKFENWTTAYGRDRSEKDTQAHTSKSVDEFKGYFTESWCEYCYMFDDGTWYVFWNGSGFFDMSPSDRPDDFITVASVLQAEQAVAIAGGN